MMNQLLMSVLSQRKSVLPEPQGETWVINQNITTIPPQTTIQFISANTNYSQIRGGTGFWLEMYYDNERVYDEDESGGFVWNEYRTVYFPIPPTVDLLTWLQANAVKQ